MNNNEVLNTTKQEIIEQQGTNALTPSFEDTGWDVNSIIEMSEQADKVTKALKKISQATLGITTEKDWVLIGGTPYLQESGAAKVASMFGISIQILNTKAEPLGDGFFKYIYTVRASRGNRSIEVEGERSMKDQFFYKEGKRPDDIDVGDVRQAAYTNATNNAIKRMIPGLRNITVDELKSVGLNIEKIPGFTFKTGSRGGKDPKAESGTELHCESCGKEVSQKVASYSQANFDGKIYCMDCQKKISSASNYSKQAGGTSVRQKPADKWEEIIQRGEEERRQQETLGEEKSELPWD